MRNRQQINTINYLVVCVSEFADRFNLNGKDAFNYLSDHGGITFLLEHYEIEHTLSLEDAIEDLVHICKRNGGTLA